MTYNGHRACTESAEPFSSFIYLHLSVTVFPCMRTPLLSLFPNGLTLRCADLPCPPTYLKPRVSGQLRGASTSRPSRVKRKVSRGVNGSQGRANGSQGRVVEVQSSGPSRKGERGHVVRRVARGREGGGAGGVDMSGEGKPSLLPVFNRASACDFRLAGCTTGDLVQQLVQPHACDFTLQSSITALSAFHLKLI